MERFIITAISIDKDYGNAFVIEGVDMYYFINERPEMGGFDTVYPCPVGQVAGRFRNNWLLDYGEPVPDDLVKRIEAQQNSTGFIKFVELQKLQFGEKRFLL